MKHIRDDLRHLVWVEKMRHNKPAGWILRGKAVVGRAMLDGLMSEFAFDVTLAHVYKAKRGNRWILYQDGRNQAFDTEDEAKAMAVVNVRMKEKS